MKALARFVLLNALFVAVGILLGWLMNVTGLAPW